ncbi:MAG TPA: LPXTG cell wall anchor domain-containing protein, partial [Rubrobacteraceae bacterium]|nr:LPXTG cell wall anchor domain-containing protein [Rubrobacteraceae bacterium]
EERSWQKLRKLMLMAAMVALALVAAAPAVAQISQEAEQEDVESGGVEPAVGIANKGNQVNLCAAVLQQAQSGNGQNVQGTSQYEVVVDDIEFEGSTITITPELVSECTQTIQQAAAAAAKGEAKAEKAKAEAKAGKAEAKAGKAEAKAGKAEAKALPKTGGVAGATSLLGLGAGALLVAGGLIARRITR